MIVGPAFNFIAINFNYNIGPFLLDNLSAPGFLMTVAWLLLEILIILFYKNLNEFIDESNTTNNLNNSIRTLDREIINSSILPIDEDGNSLLNENDSILQINNENEISSSYQSSKTVRIIDNSETGSIFLRLYNEYIRDEVIAVYFAAFTVFFMQTSLETFLTPFTKDYFNWNEESNSILYSVCGVEIMIVFIILSFLSKKITDRVRKSQQLIL